jgi:periplasmic glucans biosynthesis protein
MLHRCVPIFAAALAVYLGVAAARAGEPFSFDVLKRQAEALAAAPHVPPTRVAEPFLKLDYDGYRMIAAERNNALWRDAQLPFWSEFFPAGFIFEYPVEVYTVNESRAEQVAPTGKWFQFRSTSQRLANEPGNGFSGFRLLSQLVPNGEMDEFIVFQGASYFRGRVEPYGYGASARALAVDVGLPTAEEFPRFRKFWLERPKKDAKSLRVWALIDSPAEAGACQFVITPGKPLSIDTEMDIWFRHHVQKVGIAPQTSMWMWDPSTATVNDPRPEVHDSDGLLIQTRKGEWTWRPLDRPKSRRVSRWPTSDLAGFGLLQRDRDAAHYGDNEAKYHERPSLWVAPLGDWGPGHVELLQLPAEHEGMDNIGAYWVSEKPVDAKSHVAVKYRLTFGEAPSEQLPEWKIVDTRTKQSGEARTYEIEFATADQPAAAALPRASVSCESGAVENIETLPQNNGRLLVRFMYRPAAADTAQIQAQLRTGTETVSENWSYLWTRH